ncbi:uncharacterized protein [Rutidosis leptorrhynchoides]|uniref:uncharacterized protein n=1 Tax=Rutidosis leptorrhynchoides TaxID=125765 RepID=UPI003A98DD44
MPICFVSKILQQSEVNYPPIEKLVYALTHTARRLRRYFQAHSILKQQKKVDHPQNVKANNNVWELHTDGASSEEGVDAGLVLTSPEGEEHTYALRFCFYASNNEAEYEALLSGLRIASEMGIKHLCAYVDSQIVAHQIPRNKNKKADVLSKLATLTFDHLHKKVLVEVLKDKSVDEKVVVATVEEGEPCWITPYVKYLQDGTLPTNAMEARRIRVSAPLYFLKNRVLYRKSFNGPNLRCLTPHQAIDVVKEMHEGLCAHHSVSSAWPFCKWAIDIVGPFPRSVGNAKFLVVAIDFFSKWVEAKVLAKITGENIKKFVWNDIVCRYGLPNEIVSDNGKQFADNPFRSWCEELNIKQTFTSVAHPQANGQVEVTNKEIVAGIKVRLGLSQTKWVD